MFRLFSLLSTRMADRVIQKEDEREAKELSEENATSSIITKKIVVTQVTSGRHQHSRIALQAKDNDNTPKMRRRVVNRNLKK